MNTKRLLRDFLILVVAGGGLWSIYQTFSMFGGQITAAPEASAFSPIRERADKNYSANRWEQAAEAYRELAAEDPFNGTAWFRLGASWLFQREDLKREYNAQANRSLPDEARVAELQELITAAETQAAAAFRRSVDFAYYRNESRRQLAGILVAQGQTEDGLEMLEEAVRDGYCTRYSLSRAPEFESLADNPRFGRILEQEMDNLNTMVRRRDNLPNVFGR